jgi:uncharacterized integral membrane protein (TIGR00698 family)
MILQDKQKTKFQGYVGLLPGIGLAAIIAFLGIQGSEWIGRNVLNLEKSPISGIMIAIIIGLIIGNLVVLPAWIKPGVQFSLKIILRAGIILLGIRLSLSDIVKFGSLAIPLIMVCITGALLITLWLGRRLELSPRMSALVAVGTSICGATAIVATGPAIDAKEEELTYAIANITVFGILAMLIYPYLAHALFATNQTAAGLFLGTSVHETAQVAGSGLIYSQLYQAEQALNVATLTKLIRNACMMFVVPLLAYLYQNNASTAEKKKINILKLFPLFILGFLLMAIIRTIGDVTLENGAAYGFLSSADWSSLTKTVQQWSEIFLAMAMAAVGLGTSFRQLQKLGLKPFYVGFGAAAVTGLLSIIGILILQP